MQTNPLVKNHPMNPNESHTCFDCQTRKFELSGHRPPSRRQPRICRLRGLGSVFFLLTTASSPLKAAVTYDTLAPDGSYATGGWVVFGSAYGYVASAESFTPAITGNLTTIDLGVIPLGAVGSNTTFTVSLTANHPSGGPLMSQVLASSALVVSTTGSFPLTTFTYSGEDILLSANTTYWIVLTPENSNTAISWRNSTQAISGEEFYSGDGINFQRNGDIATAFRVNVNPIPEPAALALLSLSIGGWLMIRRR